MSSMKSGGGFRVRGKRERGAGGSTQKTRAVFRLRTIARILPHVGGLRAPNRDTVLAVSEFRIEKGRADAVITLSDGTSVHGSFFVAGSSATHHAPERVKDVLSSEAGFFPFEVGSAGGERTVIYNRAHVVMVKLENPDEPRQDPAYEVATRRSVSMLLSNGTRVLGTVLVHRPSGHDRLSDFARTLSSSCTRLSCV
jgi:hypothetical protein